MASRRSHRQGDLLGYSFTGTNLTRFEISSRCIIKNLKDVIKQVMLVGILFVEYGIIELQNNEDVLKVLAESNYWKRFIPIKFLIIFGKPITQPALITDEDVAHGETLE